MKKKNQNAAKNMFPYLILILVIFGVLMVLNMGSVITHEMTTGELLKNMSDNKVKLLIVEDDKEIRELLGAFLTDNGYEISYAANGIEATNKFTPEYDLVLLDIMLPFKSGEQVLTDIRKTSDVPVIIISAKDMKPMSEKEASRFPAVRNSGRRLPRC